MTEWILQSTAFRLRTHVNELADRCDVQDPLGAMRQLNTMLTLQQALAADLVEQGVRAGKTQKAMADALGVPPSTLRGARQEFAA